MPSASQPRRVKGKKITRAYIIGSEAWRFTDKTRPDGIPTDHTTGWRVYVKGLDGGPVITSWLKKVQFKLFHTYMNPLRTVEAPPFEVRETGWGGFQIDVRLHFQPYANEKPQWRSHFLQLEPYGSDEEKKLQQERNLVVSEICDFIEFSEPAESLWDALTDELQWVDFSQPKSGKGKGRGAPKIKAPPDDDERWPILPDHAPSSSPYSYQLEAQVLDMLQAAQTEVTALVEEEAARRTAADAKLRELQQGGDVGATEG